MPFLISQVLHGMHHRHLRPWEMFSDEDESASDFNLNKGSFDSLGSSNSYEDEPWVAKYEKRNVIRKIFDREVWIQEPMLRQIQDTIFVQALITAFIISAVITAIFLAVSFVSQLRVQMLTIPLRFPRADCFSLRNLNLRKVDAGVIGYPLAYWMFGNFSVTMRAHLICSLRTAFTIYWTADLEKLEANRTTPP